MTAASNRVGATGARPAGLGATAPPAPPLGPDPEAASLGDLFGRLTEDFSLLMRQEVALAKAEIKEEATRAGKGAGMLGGTGIAALFGLMMISFAAAWGLAAAIPTGWAFLIVAVVWLAAAAALFVTGRRELKELKPVPTTVQTLKEDAQWARHPKS